MAFERDPASVQFDAAARRLLERAYQHPGQWTGTYLAQPDRLWMAWGYGHGIDLRARDRWGEIRWVRAFKRSVYYQLKWYGYATGMRDVRHTGPGHPRSLEWETGKLVMKPGWPGRRWAIRVRLHSGGMAANRAVQAKRPESRRYTVDAAYRSTPEDR